MTGILSRYFLLNFGRNSAKSFSSLSTSELYPSLNLARKSKYSKVTDSDLSYFKSVLKSEGQIVTDEDNLIDYNVDWMKSCRGQSRLALLPKSTSEVSKILNYCNERKLAVAPRGGNTGLVGGSVPVFDEIAISLRLMNKILNIDATSGIVTCESGVILDSLDSFVQNQGFTVPLDLGARHSCQIGGNVATNAGGIRLLRYGSLKANVLGLEFVTANGKIVDCLSNMRKDNTGYDLKSLMIGSEGTLGVITKISLLCPTRPSSVNVCLMAIESFHDVLQLFKIARGNLAEILSAFEFFDISAYAAVEKNLNKFVPFSEKYSKAKYFVLIETNGSNQDHDFEKLELLASEVLDNQLCGENGIVLASDMSKQKDIWRLREEIAVALMKDGYVYKFDVSLPQSEFPALHEAVEKRLKSANKNCRVASYGHVGDGNLHLNVTSKSYDPEVMALLDPFIFEYVRDQNGSISAEHGLGLRKRKYINYSKSNNSVEYMKLLKTTFDPNGILNPYKTVDPDLD